MPLLSQNLPFLTHVLAFSQHLRFLLIILYRFSPIRRYCLHPLFRALFLLLACHLDNLLRRRAWVTEQAIATVSVKVPKVKVTQLTFMAADSKLRNVSKMSQCLQANSLVIFYNQNQQCPWKCRVLSLQLAQLTSAWINNQ